VRRRWFFPGVLVVLAFAGTFVFLERRDERSNRPTCFGFAYSGAPAESAEAAMSVFVLERDGDPATAEVLDHGDGQEGVVEFDTSHTGMSGGRRPLDIDSIQVNLQSSGQWSVIGGC
jgi:hypothetical protein